MRSDTFGPSALATPANVVTIGRVVLTPVLLVMIATGGDSWPAFVLWVALTSTDGVDGWIARRQGTTRSGAFLDPLADKFLVLGAVVTLALRGAFWWVPVAVISVREVGISVYRSWMARRGVSVPARWWAKVKTVVQELAVGFVLLPVTATTHSWIGRALLWTGAVLAVVTGAQYLLDGRKVATGAV